MTPRNYERALTGKRQQMQAHDSQPPRVRELVAEHNVEKGRALYRAELLAAPKCPHGRLEASCAQCTYQKAKQAREAMDRRGEVLTRKSGDGAAAVLERARKRGLDV